MLIVYRGGKKLLLKLEEGMMNPAFIQCIEQGVGEAYKDKYIITLMYKTLVVCEESYLKVMRYIVNSGIGLI